MELSGDTILVEKDLLGFDSFKRVVLALREEKGFHNSEADTLFHFCSFISGLAILSKKDLIPLCVLMRNIEDVI